VNRVSLGKFLVALIAASLPTRLHLVFVYEINWDEFLNLSMERWSRDFGPWDRVDRSMR
jgi:hypothetical protein